MITDGKQGKRKKKKERKKKVFEKKSLRQIEIFFSPL